MLRGAFYAFLIYSAYYLSKKKKVALSCLLWCFWLQRNGRLLMVLKDPSKTSKTSFFEHFMLG